MNKDNISLDERAGQWELDSNWSYVRLVKWSKRDKNGAVKRYTLTGKITPDKSLPMFTATILSDEDYTRVIMREDFDNVMSFLVFVKKHMKDFPGLTNELLDTFIKYRKEQSRIDESINLDRKYGDSETLENGWTLSYDGYQAKLEKSDKLENGILRRYEIAINTHPSRLKEWMVNYFSNVWDNFKDIDSVLSTLQEYGYRSNNLFDLVRDVNKNMDKFPGLTKEMFNKLVKFSEEAKKYSKEKFSQEESKEDIITEESKFSNGWEYKEWINTESPKIKIEYKDWSNMNNRKTYSIYVNIDYFDRQEIHHQDPFWVHISESNDMMVKTVLSKYFKEPISFIHYMSQNLDKFPNLTIEDINKLIKIGYEKLKEYREKQKTFNSIDITQESVEDYLSEGLEELDETTLKDLLMAAGVLGLAGTSIYQGTQELNKIFPGDQQITQQNDGDYLKVPEYKDMPNIWKDIPKSQTTQKVSINNKKVNTTKKVEPKKPEINKSDLKNKLVSRWTTETWKDANGKEFKLDNAIEYLVGHENFSPKAYRDGYIRDKNGKKIARYSIGYGTVANGPKDTITKEQAKKDMIAHIKKYVLPKYRHMIFPTQNQFNSAVSFTYNTGKMPPLNDQGEIDWRRFMSYNHFKGKVNDAIQRRRNAEFFNAQLFDEI